VAFLESWLFSSQSGLFQYFLNFSDWLDKSRPSNFCFDHVNRLIFTVVREGLGYLQARASAEKFSEGGKGQRKKTKPKNSNIKRLNLLY